ncbi:hypothetical protein BAE44_0017542 [Dichanthelium oligosanthes]|uniref:J domain-containing protein n=1 Tax=Dichanthelium oligosanthes TaxID=888268 RepID=A0A1E5V8J4_9POAL|nr:hypothetical protein BAE44_0017542 [Dichanthelium oligosanthes]
MAPQPPEDKSDRPGGGDGASREQERRPSKAWGIVIFGLIGATTATFAITQVRRSVDWFYTQQRIRHMQSVFNRERNKFRRGYESWRENGPPGGYNYIPRDDWYWQTDTSHSEHKNRRTYTPAGPRIYPMSHHYAVLGLDRSLFKSLPVYFCLSVNLVMAWSRATPYTDAEVKTAFRTKAMEVHPDQNQDDREAAEERFKEVVKSYEAIKLERKNGAN